MFSHIKPYRDEYLSALDDLGDYRVRIERQCEIKNYLEVRNTLKSNCYDKIFEPLMYVSAALSIALICVCVVFDLDYKWVIASVICVVLMVVFGTTALVAEFHSDSYRHETKRINRIAKDYNKFPDEPVIQAALLSAMDDLEMKLRADLARGVLTREEAYIAKKNKKRSRVVNKYL